MPSAYMFYVALLLAQYATERSIKNCQRYSEQQRGSGCKRSGHGALVEAGVLSMDQVQTYLQIFGAKWYTSMLTA